VVVIDKCVIDGLAHDIVLDLDTVRIQTFGEPDGGAPVQVMREAILTCPTTGRQFRATVPLPQASDEIIAGIHEVSVKT
jgi:hypothetical protein